MNTQVFRFKLGDFNCAAVSDGIMQHAPANVLFANAPKESLDWYMSQTKEPWADQSSSFTCLLVETAELKILVDTGGNGMDSSSGKLLPNLKQAGISPEDIDMVIITHCHPDHIGGNTDAEGKPVFTKARWVMDKNEYEFWTSDETARAFMARGAGGYIDATRKNLSPLKGKIDLTTGETEIVPGVRTIPAYGHTPGQIAVEVSSKGKRLVYISDLLLHPLHILEPEWHAPFDTSPEQTVMARRKILPELADGDTLVLAFHFRFPSLGRIVPKGNAWQWQPVETTV